jgi:hypothetical protein
MPIGGSATEFNITGAKLKVSGGVQVSGSIAYTNDATGFGGVTAQIDGNNTLNITAGKTSGVAKIERSTTATINAINHTNVSNNTTIHIALKNTSDFKGDFVTIGTFTTDDTVKVNYTDEYVIGPGETGMLTLRKVNGVLSLFIREMFSSTATNTDTKPFYIKDGTNYKYPLYKTTGENLTITPVAINGVSYYQPSGGYTTKTRPPKGLPELIVTPTGNLAIGNNGNFSTVNYDVWGVPSSFDYGSIYQGSTKKTSFVLENGEASGSFTESEASSGDAYSLYVERTNTNLTDTVALTVQSNQTQTIAFHHGAFSASDYSSAYSTVGAAATAGFVYSDTVAGDYTWGVLGTPSFSASSNNTTYTYTSHSEITGADVLMVAGGGGGGGHVAGGGGAGGLLHHTNQTLSGQKTIVVGGGGHGGASNPTRIVAGEGENTTFTDLTTAVGGGAASSYDPDVAGTVGGSGGGGGHTANGGAGTAGQGFAGANSSSHSHSGGGGGAGGAGTNGQGGTGGVGLDKSSVFGTTYGESGWFAGGGGGGARTDRSDGPGGQGGGGDGKKTSNVDGDDGTRHTGGGGGGNGTGSGTSGAGGSGIVLIKFTGDKVSYIKKIPKITGASFDSTNVTFTVQGASNITNIKYTINGGEGDETPVGTLAVAHGLASAASISVVAWAVNANGNQISTKKTVTGTIP